MSVAGGIERHGEDFTERDFSLLVQQALPEILGAASIEREPRLKGGARPDFLVFRSDGAPAIVELKIPTPMTVARLERVAAQLRSYGEAFAESSGGRGPQLVLVVPGTLTLEHIAQLRKAGVGRVVDGPALRDAAPDLPWPPAVRERHVSSGPRADKRGDGGSLEGRLASIAPGKPEWPAYQRVVRDILAETLSPPLEQPLDEHRNQSGVNRRDIILANYAESGGWKFLRDHYEAHYVVVDAKNYKGGVKKKDVLQIANYLSAHGAGLFGIIVCRKAEHRSAEITRREQWVIHRKLILLLDDDDLRTMLTLFATGQDPSTVIRQKVEDFRLGF
ncbi:MAG: hypothetical protein J0I37_11920 [Microbacterium sp.]|nr:hypothetical protein [Microbacterium sp.]